MLGQQIFTPQAKIDYSNQTEHEQKLTMFINGSLQQDILIDFKTVEFVDSHGLMALVNAYRHAKKAEKNFYLLNVSPAVRIILEISRLDQFLAIKESNFVSYSTQKLAA